jgi:hypothetical protein
MSLPVPVVLSLSIGTNRSPSGASGLKILCNNIKATNYDIAVMQDTLPNPLNGIHNLQYVEGISPSSDRSAANQFLAYDLNNPYRNYFLDSNTNNLSDFLYKYYSPVALENPVYRTPFTTLTTNPNTCPVHHTRSPQDSLPLVAAPGSRLRSTAHREEKQEETSERPLTEQAARLAAMRSVSRWLQEHDHSWTALPESGKQQVYDAAQNDPMYAGATARSLLTRYEGKQYNPIVLIPENNIKNHLQPATGPFGEKIYPNPTTGKVAVSWSGENGLLHIYDLSGKRVWKTEIQAGISRMDPSPLSDGVYLAVIQTNGKSVYQQKIVIR